MGLFLNSITSWVLKAMELPPPNVSLRTHLALLTKQRKPRFELKWAIKLTESVPPGMYPMEVAYCVLFEELTPKARKACLQYIVDSKACIAQTVCGMHFKEEFLDVKVEDDFVARFIRWYVPARVYDSPRV